MHAFLTNSGEFSAVYARPKSPRTVKNCPVFTSNASLNIRGIFIRSLACLSFLPLCGGRSGCFKRALS